MKRLTARASAVNVRDKPALPLTEPVQKETRPNGFFAKMSDDELVAYAIRVIAEKRITNRTLLLKVCGMLYRALWKRNLLDRTLSSTFRNWKAMSDDALVAHAKQLIAEHKITNITGLANVDGGLNYVLRKRNLLYMLFPETKKQKNWVLMSDATLVEYATCFIAENKVTSRSSLQKTYPGLYEILRQRHLLNSLSLEKKKQRDPRSWASMTSDNLVVYAVQFVTENEIRNRKGLHAADVGLYQILRTRNLLDCVFPKSLEQKPDLTVLADALREF